MIVLALSCSCSLFVVCLRQVVSYDHKTRPPHDHIIDSVMVGSAEEHQHRHSILILLALTQSHNGFKKNGDRLAWQEKR